ncbi:hypothetical protein [Legionella bozemanae]|uniref:Uncharacterized protein n=1 Tax=Legionella bozemanae TaxID=447 RepID=A0A0W0RTU9_LEGBO|nr:hypothetical protein [Legionella bozemanae]KTC74472.1 hypothetical protein Lboz_1385 [Legionella bozemanae]STO32387.1 Uncharacterised protein [Legionella bozemanae]
MSYRDFSSFHNIKLLFGNPKEGLNYGYTCTPNFQPVQNSSFDGDFFLLFRRSEYAAQVELACSKIFKGLMGYGPELEIIKENNEFYIASRRIKNFREGCPDLKEQSQFQDIKGLAGMFIICYFLCETDMHSGNFGLQDTGKEKRTFRIDMAESLDYEMLRTTLTLSSLQKIPYIVEQHYHGVDENSLPQNYVSSESFQNEKIAMIKLIANTPFSFFEDIIRTTITSDLYTHQQIMFDKCLALVEDEEEITSMKNAFSKIEANECDIESLIKLLKNRHEQWQLLALEKNLDQDFSLANPSLFMKELNLYHGNTSESEGEEELSYSDQGISLNNSYSGIGFFPSPKNDGNEDNQSKTNDFTPIEYIN